MDPTDAERIMNLVIMAGAIALIIFLRLKRP
jgi:hypothetical protein